ncbi:HypC/HybG/HupF family hydrogenase formation chaperone [Thiorhodococcus minor]|uniref:HypC/HybG/HupF family hydrogenase formation chaperone n=1 Tax=Thiorhodococcus minor TaxID=57489 RepID=A0A6M0K0Y7_9GAMM|nr:HypC/HybG/HupF family hydrogenase formation chaperone [Thiorhodococcus minor]NEV63410.1 HypC/HybG/HupF family hydrogenase formation chaperone [Thiorhodococcus minor]
MCIGVPMQVIESGPVWAWCDDGGERQRVDMQLVGAQPPGAWVLVFLGVAREVMGETQALRVRDALAAMQAAMAGESVDHLFADLVDREPQLPEHLRGP